MGRPREWAPEELRETVTRPVAEAHLRTLLPGQHSMWSEVAAGTDVDGAASQLRVGGLLLLCAAAILLAPLVVLGILHPRFGVSAVAYSVVQVVFGAVCGGASTLLLLARVWQVVFGSHGQTFPDAPVVRLAAEARRTVESLIDLVRDEGRGPIRAFLIGQYAGASRTGRSVITTSGLTLYETVVVPGATLSSAPVSDEGPK